MVANFFGLLDATLRKNLDQELIVWPQSDAAAGRYTGRAILGRVAALGEQLAFLRLRKGQQVLLALPIEADLIFAMLAVMAQGGIPVLPPARATPLSLFRLVRKGSIHAVIAKKEWWLPLRLLAKVLGVRLTSTKSKSATSLDWVRPQPVDPGQAALVSHSSGSTGKAKAIHRSHRILLAQHLALKEAFPPWSGQRDFPLFPNILLHNLAVGTLSIFPDLPRFNVANMRAESVLNQLAQQQVQTMTGNIFYFNKLLQRLEQQPVDLTTVRAVGIGGSPVPEKLLHLLRKFFTRAEMFVIYGSSEAEPIAARKVGSQPADPRLGYAVGSIVASLEWRIHPIGEVIIPNVGAFSVGEIEVRGGHVVVTEETGWLQTGDFGYVNEKQELYLTGRKGNETLHYGIQHYQVEHVLLHSPGVENAAVRSLEEGFVVYIQGTISKTTVWKVLGECFPQAIFLQVYFRATLPVDARHHSKIRYENLR